MLDANINKVEKVEGSNIFIFQYIDSDGKSSEERKSFEDFLKPFIKPYLEQIDTLKESLKTQVALTKEKDETKAYLNKEVLSLSQEIQNLEKEKQQRIEQIEHLLKEVSGKDISEEDSLYKQAFNLFVEGKIDEALLVLNEAKLEEEEKKAIENIKQVAQTRILKAQLLRVEHKYQEAGENYEKAVQLYESFGNCFKAAYYFQYINDYKRAQTYHHKCLDKVATKEQKATILNSLGNIQRAQNDYAKASASYEEALSIYRALAAKNPYVYLPDVAGTLNNLGNLQRAQNDYATARASYKEALSIYQALAADNPQTYVPDVGMTLNNLGALHRAQNDYVTASASYEEALSIYRALVAENPQTYLPDVGMTLNNLAILQRNQNDYNKASASYEEALSIYRALAADNPQTYLPKVGVTLNNLAILQSDQNKYDKANASYEEALSIYRALATDHPQAYVLYVAGTLNNLGNLQKNLNDHMKASASYKEVLSIYRALAAETPKAYLPYVAGTLNNLGNLQRAQNDYANASASYKEALSIRRALAADNPQTYIPDVGVTLINLSIFYQELQVDKELSIQYVDEAITILLPFQKIGYIQNYLQRGVKVLKDWDIDVRVYLEKKLKELVSNINQQEK